MDWTTIIISIAGAIAVSIITGVLTMHHSQEKFLSENSKADVNKAIMLAELYATEIVPLLDYVSSLYSKNKDLRKAQIILAEKRKHGKLLFTKKEMDSLFDHESIKAILEGMDPYKMNCGDLYTVDCIVPLGLTEDQKMQLYQNHEKQLGDIDDGHLINVCAFACAKNQQGLLNRLEYFSMYFNTELANSGTVYQSLHQTFISAVMLMYFDISNRNIDPKDYYYTNVLTLFNKWNDEFNAQVEKEDLIKARTDEEIEEISKKPESYKK